MLFQQIEYGKQWTHKYNQFINSPGQPLEKGLIIIQIRLIWGQQDFVFPIRIKIKITPIQNGKMR